MTELERLKDALEKERRALLMHWKFDTRPAQELQARIAELEVSAETPTIRITA